MNRFTIVALPFLFASPASAHCYSIWHYNFPQPSCNTHVVQRETPQPPPKPVPSIPIYLNVPDEDIPLPSLEHMEFPPDCLADWCQRMKGIGMLREKMGTN